MVMILSIILCIIHKVFFKIDIIFVGSFVLSSEVFDGFNNLFNYLKELYILRRNVGVLHVSCLRILSKDCH